MLPPSQRFYDRLVPSLFLEILSLYATMYLQSLYSKFKKKKNEKLVKLNDLLNIYVSQLIFFWKRKDNHND